MLRPLILEGSPYKCQTGVRAAPSPPSSLRLRLQLKSMRALAAELLLPSFSFADGSSVSVASMADEQSNSCTDQLLLQHTNSVSNVWRSGTRAAQNSSYSAQGSEGLPSAEVLRSFGHLLVPLEKSEILAYGRVWYVSSLTNKTPLNPWSSNYDNDGGNYGIEKGDHIAFQYEMCSLLGRGSFGQVYECLDHKTGVNVAVKIVKNKKFFNKQVIAEISILNKLEPDGCATVHNCVPLLDSFKFRGHMCLVFPLYYCNLYQYMKLNGFSRSPISFILSVAAQLLTALNHLYELGIVHLDIKPENIMLRSVDDSSVVLIDFGSSCHVNDISLAYVQSRFYRSPEVLLGLAYGPAADMWSLACVSAELYTGRPMFEAEDEEQLFLLHCELLGPAPSSIISVSPNRNRFVDENLVPIIKASVRGDVRRPNNRSLQDALGGATKEFVELFERLFLWAPEERPLPHEALEMVSGLQMIIPFS